MPRIELNLSKLEIDLKSAQKSIEDQSANRKRAEAELAGNAADAQRREILQVSVTSVMSEIEGDFAGRIEVGGNSRGNEVLRGARKSPGK